MKVSEEAQILTLKGRVHYNPKHKFWTQQATVVPTFVGLCLASSVLFGTEMAEAQCNTFRMKILKVAAVVTESVRRIVFSLSNVYPLRDLWFRIYNRLQPGYTAPSG